ncbi:PREDICTED: F-box/LRR-repeat protein 4-like [Vollenhovia emeryi]|uniref:F-box/LRR-repeat protein 4-like n=1 Tax=Vollenhovia emeryi TaxID=411798 RepID=UPI0005F450DF|nr:PREDICTED: F-box/LRR-repeat protein 4-like [Vollenhovia emeryi]
MTSYYRFYKKDEGRYPCVKRVYVGKEHVDFLYQFVKDSRSRYNISSGQDQEYIKKDSSSKQIVEDISKKLIGDPNKYNNVFYGSFFMRSGGFKISISWQEQPRILSSDEPDDDSSVFYNYIDLEFDKAVYPIRVSIYEMYRPGYITQIWAHNSEENRWFPLWTGKCQAPVLEDSRLFSPPLQFCDFKTKRLRLKFTYSFLYYETKLAAVMLIGTSKLILSKNTEGIFTSILKNVKGQHLITDNLTPIDKHAHWDITHLQENFSIYCTIYTSYLHSNYARIRKYFKLSLDNSKKLTPCGFSTLPDEMILKILKYLDIRSLCHMSTMNKRLNNLTRDGSLFKCLNLLNMREVPSIYQDNIISYFTSRCKYLQKLHLSSSIISTLELRKLLDICSERLTHLRLSYCSLKSTAFDDIAERCNNLQVLDLSLWEVRDSFESILSADITLRVCKLLERNPRLRELNLDSGDEDLLESNFFYVSINVDSIATQLRDSCPNVEIRNISGYDCTITSEGIDALAECKNLRKLNIEDDYWIDESLEPIGEDSLRRLFSACQRLEEIKLMNYHDNVGELLTLCKNLKEVHLKVLPLNVLTLPLQCPKLQKIYFVKGDEELIHRMKQEYPHVSLCKLEYVEYMY